MCSEFDAVTDEQRLLAHFGATYAGEREAKEAGRRHVFPTLLAPFIRLHEEGSGNRVIEEGAFGLLPAFAKELAYGRRTYNARSETVHRLPSFREAWTRGWRCVVPIEAEYAPCYETGRAVRWEIRRADSAPLAVAGIFRKWHSPGGKVLWSFAMLTVSAEGHPVHQRMHRPGEEKRMLVILERDEMDDWLTCTVEEARKFFRQSRVELVAIAAPQLRPRGPQQAF